MAQATGIPSINIGDNNANSCNITSSFNHTVYNSDEDAQIMRWLSPLEPNNRHQDVRIDRFEGVGDWVLETSEFREWRGGEGGPDKAVLFCSGNPGVGKTYLSSLVIDRLCDQGKKEDIAVACLYCDFLVQQEQTIASMMGAILKQLVGKRDIPTSLRKAFEEGKKEIGGRGLLLADLMGMLRTTIASLPQVFICIDALDECIPRHLQLLKSLRDIVRECPRTRIFLTGRPNVREDILRYFTKAIVIPISPNADDIKNYLEMRLAEDVNPEAMSDELRADIKRTILEKISDIFLLVSLNIEAILAEVTIGQRRKKLEEMTRGNGLGDAYTATLMRLKAQKGNMSELGLKVLMWVSYSERPLRVKELCHALGVEMGSTDLDPETIPALRTLLASCLGLVTVEASSSTVRLIHFTLQEHLTSDSTFFPRPHSAIAETCLTYLNFGCVRDLSPTLHSAPSTMPLLGYASCYWGKHTRMGMTENVKILALRLLDRFDEHISAQLLLLHYNKYKDWMAPYFDWRGGPTGFTGLHGVAFLGIWELVVAVLETKKWDVNAVDGMGSTALVWAAVRGQDEVVKVLLERKDVNPNLAETEYGRTPLSWAAVCGYEGIVKMLLERKEVNPDQADTNYGQTPLSWAAEHGYEGIVKMLLERKEVNPDQADTKYGQTPLSLAAEGGHEGVVYMLLEREDVNPDRADTKYGQTPLSWAAERGYEGIVKMLLERKDVNPNHTDPKHGRTPLLWAAQRGHEGIAKMLLERKEVDPDRADTKYGRTPLLWAARHGHEGIAKMLLERKEVDPDRADTKYGRTPLSWAARHGHEGIAKMLLERKELNPDQADTKYGRTPLLWAAVHGNEGIVRMLLERKEVNPDQADTKYGRTPLSWAAGGGHTVTFVISSAPRHINPDETDIGHSRMPLPWEAERKYEGIVKMLLERKDVNPDQADTKHVRTPLSWAAKYGYEGIVKMLLERKDVNSDHADTRYGRTPLSLAREAGHAGVARILLERGNTNPDVADCHGQASLPPSPTQEGQRAADMQFRPNDPDTDPADLNNQSTLPSVDPDEGPKALLNPKDSVSESADSDLSPTEPSKPSQPPPTWPLNLWYPPKKNDTHPNTPPSPFSFATNRRFIITSLILLFAFLLHILPASSLDIFSFRKYFPKEGLA